jgi:8-oxo-dGTP pyrophosphatase MutT (NUDIX family)
MSARPVRPRDAASLILIRESGEGGADDCLVLLGRRAARHAFLPHFYVFPGGRLDAEDYSAAVASDIAPDVADRVALSCPNTGDTTMPRALAVAAVRETHEETGLLLGGLGEGGAVRPELAPLDYVGRAITPPESPIRFHARFFTCAAELATGDLKGSGELLDLGWRPIRAALSMPIADVTEFMLEEVIRLRRGSSIRAGAPLFSYRNGKPTIRYE